MNNEMYEVVLMIEKESDSAHNPIFLFGSKDHAFHQLETFISQGYESLIRISRGE